MSNLNITLVALHGAVALQFARAPHYVEGSVITKGGHTVNLRSGDGPALHVSYKDSDLPDGGTKRKFNITLQAPVGPGLRNVVSVNGLGADRDTVIAAITEAVASQEGGTTDDVKIILADGVKPGAEAPAA